MFDRVSRPALRARLLAVPSFAPLRASLWAILGLSAVSCGDGGGGGGGGGPVPITLCEGATMILQANGQESGFAECPDGSLHRVYPATCDTSVTACDGSESNTQCTSDADCTEGPNGKCGRRSSDPYYLTEDVCGCIYPCETDADCGGDVCVCAGVVARGGLTWSECANASSCNENADCPSGECGISSHDHGCGHDVGLACRNADDVCRSSADCPSAQCVTANGSNEWECLQDTCGRPLVVEGRARTAERAARGDWTMARLRPELASLSAEERSALAVYWHEIAALEHASIGSFARFTLELLALGAPADLLGEVQQATADEIAHARAAYALASAYEGRDVGPGRLDMTGIAPSTDVRSIVTALVVEACVGETLGAAEARALAGMVSDPELAAVYARIADDEARHAELGWRTLSWLLRTRGDEVREVARRTFDQAIAAAGNDPRVTHGLAAPERGLLSSTMLGALRRQALSEVVAPCARGLFAQTLESAVGSSG